ncbi:MAG: zinc-dependent metalloprotease [Myxococcales bacterium]|nr:zinc-dependent metalloprotease [Myxococcales bacterium]
MLSRVGALLVASAGCLVLVGCVEDPPTAESVPTGGLAKADLAGEWVVGMTTVWASPETNWAFEGDAVSSFGGAKIRWEVQEHHLVAYESFERIAGGNDGASTGLPDPGTRCFDAASGTELSCLPDPTKGTRGHVFDPGVVCRGPNGDEVDCLPYRGDVVAMYPVRRHYDVRLEGERAVVDTTRPWYLAAHVEVDWGHNLVEQTFDRSFVFLDREKRITHLGADLPHRDGFFTNRSAAGELESFDFVTRLFVEPELSAHQSLDGLFYWYGDCRLLGPCTAAEVHVRTAFRRVDPEEDFEPRPYGERQYSHFPLFRSERVSFDPYAGFTIPGRVQLAQAFPIWEQVYRRSADGSIERDESGAPVEIPHADRVVRPIRFYLTGEWPVDLFETVEDVIADYDAILKEAAQELREGAPVDADMVMLDYNGLVREVDATGLETECAALVEAGVATVEVLDDGRPACGFSDYAPGRYAAFFDRATPRHSEWRLEPERRVAVLGDLVHHSLHWVHAPQQAGPLGYGPSFIDPESAKTIAAQPAIYGHALNTYTTLTLAAINVQNGRLSMEAYLAGEGAAVDQVTSGQTTFELADPTAQIRRRLLERARGAARPDVALLGEDGARELELAVQHATPLSASRGSALLAAAVENDGTAAELLRVESPDPDAHPSYVDTALLEAASARQRRALENNVTLADFYDPFTVAVADRYKDLPTAELAPMGSAWLEIRRLIAGGLIAHEMGHTFGLRHNFRASHDAINYSDRYWELRRTTLAPASELTDMAAIVASATPTEEQLSAGMPAEAASSVMDYHASFNEGARLGRYDRAALMLLYAGRVEVFDSPAESLDPDWRDAARSAFLATDRFTQAPARAFHYAQVPFLLGNGDATAGVEALKRRRWARWDEVVADQELGSEATLVPVPYESCTDYELGMSEGCLLYDAGADPYEMAVAIANRYERDVVASFRRDRVDFSLTPELRFLRSLRLFFLPFRNVYQHGIEWATARGLDYSTPRDGLWLAGTYLAANTLARVLTTPAYGPVAPSPDFSVCPPAPSGGRAGSLSVPMGIGRRLDTVYDSDSDFFEVSEVGHRSDRRAALFSLTADWYEDYAVADRGLPWSQGFGGFLSRTVGATFLGDPSLSPRIDAAGNIAFSDPLDVMAFGAGGGWGVPPAGCVLDVARDDLERYVTVIYVAAFLRESLNFRVADRFRVFRVGSSEEPQVGPSHEIISFVDPETGIVYGALRPVGIDIVSVDYPAVTTVERGRAISDALAVEGVGESEREDLEAGLRGVARDAALLRYMVHRFDALAEEVL